MQGTRRGAIVVLLALILAAMFGASALAIDFGRLWALRNELQWSADAGAHAGAVQLISPLPADALDSAQSLALRNLAMQGTVTIDSLELGDWDDVARTFTSLAAGAAFIDAVSIVVSRQSTGLVMSALGVAPPRLRARAVGWASGGTSIHFSRFLVDNEMFDPGMTWLKNLAQSLGTTSDLLLTDSDGDWFVDLPVGIVAQVPTGQVGDEALFDITVGGFQFSQFSSPSFQDFLNFNEDGTWRQSLVPTNMLDPLLGVGKVNNPNLYPNFVAPGVCQVSPLYKSDISYLGTPPNSVNALGYRRGLVTFSVDSIGVDPDGPSGSSLPNLWVTICDPASVLGGGLSSVTIGQGSATQIPILVK